MYSVSGVNLKSFDCASGEIEALIDLWLKGMKDFVNYYASIPEELLTKKIDEQGITAISVGKHIMGGALSHATWSIELAGLPGPDKERPALKDMKSHSEILKNIKNRQEILEEAERLMSIIPLGFAPMTNEHLSKQGTTLWGEHMSSEGMIEHTIMHFHRHIRQLKRRLWNG